MPLHFLNDTIWFPPVTDALEDGLLAAGGDLCPERLLLAYKSGIFPWYNEDEPPLWWSPDPRFVLYPHELKISKSMQQLLRRGEYEVTSDTAFEQVIASCRDTYRPGQGGTWIDEDITDAYTTLHKMGYAHSAEAWYNGQMAGGLYGIRLGSAFFGESMFSHRSNASKYAFIKWVQHLQADGVQIIDCQVYTPHLESLGARMIPRADFLRQIAL